jgi:hypothetical protein
MFYNDSCKLDTVYANNYCTAVAEIVHQVIYLIIDWYCMRDGWYMDRTIKWIAIRPEEIKFIHNKRFFADDVNAKINKLSVRPAHSWFGVYIFWFILGHIKGYFLEY